MWLSGLGSLLWCEFDPLAWELPYATGMAQKQNKTKHHTPPSKKTTSLEKEEDRIYS